MRDACFTWFPFQPHPCERLSNAALALFSHCSVGVSDDQIVGVADDRGGFLLGGICVFEAVFQAVEGAMCQSWGKCPALWRAFFGRKEFSTLYHTRLQPGFALPSDRGIGVDLSE